MTYACATLDTGVDVEDIVAEDRDRVGVWIWGEVVDEEVGRGRDGEGRDGDPLHRHGRST